MSIADLPALLGSVLILAGIGLVCYQLIWAPPPSRHQLGIDAGLSRWKVQTAYPGIVMICVGALLLGVGSFIHR